MLDTKKNQKFYSILERYFFLNLRFSAFNAINQKILSIDIGRYSNVATVNMEFKRVTFGFGVPTNIFANVKRYLGIDQNNKIACNPQNQIRIQISGKTLTLQSYVFADLSTQDNNGRCTAKVYDSNSTFHMPITFFRNRCQLLNYKTNQVAFGTAKPFTVEPENGNPGNNNPGSDDPGSDDPEPKGKGN